MAQLTASRTLVKSTPELWAECSEAASLTRHLGAFGEIRITKLEPETAVAWEGDDVRGTVTLEPSGWGTRVVLTASAAPASAGAPPGEDESSPSVAPEAEPTPVAEPEPDPGMPARPGFLRRLVAGWRRPPAPAPVEPGPESTAPPKPAAIAVSTPEATAAPEPKPQPTPAGTGALVGALDSLGKAHRRPFSHG